MAEETPLTSPLLAPLNEPQQHLVNLLFETYREHHSWPNWQFVERTMDRTGIDPIHTISSLSRVGSKQLTYGISYGLAWKQGTGGISYQPGDIVGLTIAGLHQAGADEYVDIFLAILAMACRKFQNFIPNPQKVTQLELSSDEVTARLSEKSSKALTLTPQELYALLEHEPTMWAGGRGIDQNGTWRWEIIRDIRRYDNVTTIEEYVEVLTRIAEESVRQIAQRHPLTLPRGERTMTNDERPHFSPEVPLLGSGIDPELWEFVRPLVEEGRWEQVAREAAAFVETRTREWTDSKRDALGLMTEVLRPRRQQSASGEENTAEHNEQEGWHLMARGFFMAVRNHVMHNSVGTEEQLQFGLGSLGTASLLVRQIRERCRTNNATDVPEM